MFVLNYRLVAIILVGGLSCLWGADRGILVVEPALGMNSQGFRLAYYSYSDELGWVSPSAYAVHFLRTENPDTGRSGELITASLGISALRNSATPWTPVLAVRLLFGNETVYEDNGTSYDHLIVGMGLAQDLLWVSKGTFGFVSGIGLFQNIQANSRLYPWDIGAKGIVGISF